MRLFCIWRKDVQDYCEQYGKRPKKRGFDAGIMYQKLFKAHISKGFV